MELEMIYKPLKIPFPLGTKFILILSTFFIIVFTAILSL